MLATSIQDILLLAISKAYEGQKNMYLMLEHIDSAVRKLEQNNPHLRRLSGRTASALIELDNQKLIHIDRGRVGLTEAGKRVCQDLELPTDWSDLPETIRRYMYR
jgi:predicted amino acid racemase